MPYGRDCFQLVVDGSESTGQHARASNELQIGAETRQIVEGQHDTPHEAGPTDGVRQSEHVINVHRHADQGEISQQARVQHLQQRHFFPAAVIDRGRVRLDGDVHQPVGAVQHGNELAELPVEKCESDQPV